ncbi:MAG TPA: class I SAM-dependent methyltransferase [Bacteroidales bacterium]|nr:class I SAM-dependent methyltransferase [Bacteroidales bacterium]HRZ49909.1 class I SAM-dependent methyltransferase [Bacteroidales bacterium]
MNPVIKNLARTFLPAWLLAVRRHCGGYQRDGRLFAANLLTPDLPSDFYSRIASHLIFPNGVRKSTYPGRNAPLFEALFTAEGYHPGKPLKILDIGASFGMDSMSNLSAIRRYAEVESYTLADLYTEVLYDPQSGIIFDQDHIPVQIKRGKGFFNLWFEFKYPVEKLYHLCNQNKTRRIRQQYKNAKPDPGHVRSIPLFHPEIMKNSLFNTARLDVFTPIPETYDLVICLNLLQTRYFEPGKVEQGMQNLKNCLNPGGVLVTGVTDAVKYYFAPPKA